MQSNISTVVQSICYGNGVWIAGGTGAIYRSEDGKTWTQIKEFSGYNYVTIYEDEFWIVGGSGGLCYSTDGINLIAFHILQQRFTPTICG